MDWFSFGYGGMEDTDRHLLMHRDNGDECGSDDEERGYTANGEGRHFLLPALDEVSADPNTVSGPQGEAPGSDDDEDEVSSDWAMDDDDVVPFAVDDSSNMSERQKRNRNELNGETTGEVVLSARAFFPIRP